MRSVCLVPYCPWPANTGTRVEMMKHLNVLRELGACTIVSARSRPVGFGWTPEAERALRDEGFTLVFREDRTPFRFRWIFDIAFAAVAKGLKMEQAFGHANPYHRNAFTESWWRELTDEADLAVMQYGFWGRFKSRPPQVVVVHELLSNHRWGGWKKEVRDWKNNDLLCVVGHDEQEALTGRGLPNVLWSPPAIAPETLPLTADVGLVGTRAPQNLEGLRWLESAKGAGSLQIRIFGNLAGEARAPFFDPVGRYGANTEPYERCGIHLMTRPDRPGLQIKVVEALAYGRVIIARQGSMRGLPPSEKAWIEVDSPEAMLREAERLSRDAAAREELASRARAYYDAHLDSTKILETLKKAYRSLAERNSGGS